MKLTKRLTEVSEKRYHMETDHMGEFDRLDYYYVLKEQEKRIGVLALAIFALVSIPLYILLAVSDTGLFELDSLLIEKLMIAFTAGIGGAMIVVSSTSRVEKVENELREKK